MWFFNQPAANFLQHLAVILEGTAMYLILSDLKIYRGDRDDAEIFNFWAEGEIHMPTKDRSSRIKTGIAAAAIAFSFEIYQLATLHLG